jgi:cytoskeletal protein CcmA (bactofilin family)
MRKIITITLLSITTLLLTGFLFFAPLSLATNGEIVLSRDETVNKDYFAAGNTVTVSGTVNGDAYVAGGNVIVDGTINGDLLTAGGNVVIRGRVANDIRAAGGQVTVSGEVGNSVTVAGGNITITDGARIGGSLVGAAGNLSTFAPIGRGATLAGGQVIIGNMVGGDVAATVGQITLTPGAVVNGNLEYWSSNRARIQSGAQVTGAVTQRVPPQPAEAAPKDIGRIITRAVIIAKLISLISYFVAGLLLIYFFPVHVRRTVAVIRERPWLSLGTGFLAVILIPIIIVLLFMTIIGIPIALILLAAFLILLYLARIYAAVWLGRLILGYGRSEDKLVWAFLIGLVIYELVTLIPIVGWIIGALVVFLGLGAVLIEEKDFYRKLRMDKEI